MSAEQRPMSGHLKALAEEHYRLLELRKAVRLIAAHAWECADIHTKGGMEMGCIANDLSVALQRSREGHAADVEVAG